MTAFHKVETDPGSGGVKLLASQFTDTDAVVTYVPASILAFGTIDVRPTVVSASDPLPVVQTGALPAGTNVIGHVIIDAGSTTVVSGTVAVTQSGSWTVSVSGVATAANQATEIASLASIDGKLTACNTGAVVISSALPAGTNVIGHVICDTGSTTAVTGNVTVINSGTFATQAAQSGTWNITNISGTVSLPTGAATAAKQPALGTAGTASSDVLTVQGIASMTALKVDGSAVTQPVSGTVTANIGTVGTLATAAKQDTGNTSLSTIAGAVAGTEMQVDVLTMPTVAVTQSGTWDEVGINDSGNSITVDAPVATPVFVRLSDGASAISTLPVSVSGVATAANQTTIIGHVDGIEALLTTIDADTSNLSVVGGGTESAAIRVTLANDSTGVVSIDDNGGSLTVDGTFWQATQPVSLASVPSHAVTNAGTFAVQESGAALTSLQLIDDTVTTLGTDTYTEATSKGITIGAVRRDADTTLVNTTNEFGPLQMDANGRLKVEAFSGETLPVSLTSTTVTGTVAVTQSGTWDEVGINDSGNSITVDNGGTFAVQAAQSGTWTVTGAGGTFPVTGTFWQATQPISIADGSDVTLGTKTDAKSTATDTTSVSVVSILKQISASVQAPPSQAVTNAGTFAVQSTLQAGNNIAGQFKLTDGTDIADVLDLTSSNPLAVAIVDGSGDQITSFGGGTQYTEDAAAAANPVGTAMIGVRADSLAGLTTTDGDNVAARMTDKGEQYVKHVDAIPITDNSGSITVDNGGTFAVQAVCTNAGTFATQAVCTNAGTFAVQATVAAGATTIGKAEDVASADADVGVPAMAVRKATPANTSGTDGDYEFLQMSVGRLWVSATVDAALPAGTNAIGKLASNTGVTIGAVEIAAAQTLATVTTVTTCSTLTTLTGGGVASDGVDSGNPIKTGARAVATLSTATLVAAADRVDNVADLDGALLVRDSAALGDLVSGTATNTDGASTQCIAAAGAGVKVYLTDITLSNTSATAVEVVIKDGTTAKWTFPVPANTAGVTHQWKSPLAGTANTAWNFDGSAAATTVSCSMSGFKSKI